MEQKLSDNNIDNYFIYITYKIIQKSKDNYKFFTIAGTDKNTNNTYISALILIKYEDPKSFEKIFKYLNSIYNFNPSIVHIDFSQSLHKSLITENLFNKPSIITHCFFHFS